MRQPPGFDVVKNIKQTRTQQIVGSTNKFFYNKA